MVNYRINRKVYFIKQIIKQHLLTYKVFYIIGSIFFVLGFATGIFSAIKYANLVELVDISDNVLISFLCKEASIFGLFFSRLVAYLFLSLIIIIINSMVFLMPISYIILIYKSFLSALTISFLIILYGFSGVLLTIFVLVPSMILFFIGLITLISVCAKRCLMCKKYGSVYFSDQVSCFPLHTIFYIFLIMLFSCVIELLLLPIISVTFVLII
ncbi:MAG: hypothetical protein PHC46_03390 [Clostridia bacterium]|nr:hypothetical protein [Clostridia bacterium]